MTPAKEHPKSRFPKIIEQYAATVDERILKHRPDRWLAFLRRVAGSRWRSVKHMSIRYPFGAYIFLTILGMSLVFAIDHVASKTKDGTIEHPSFINATTYFAAAASLIGIYQIWSSSLSNQARYIHDFFAKFFEKREFYESWYSLFYSFENSKFVEIDKLVKDGHVQSMEDIHRFNKGRKDGSRLWHPRIIAATPEEYNIDNLLGYLNLIGEFYDRGGLSVGEIGDAAEYYLLGVANSEAFRAYLDEMKVVFSTEELYTDGKGPSRQRLRYGYPPFRHLCLLLHDLEVRRSSKEAGIYDRFDQS